MSSIPTKAMPHAGAADTDHSLGGLETHSYTRGDRSGSGTTLMEKARDHRTGIAIGVAVGAVAAAALPFMLSGRSRSGSTDSKRSR